VKVRERERDRDNTCSSIVRIYAILDLEQLKTRIKKKGGQRAAKEGRQTVYYNDCNPKPIIEPPSTT
jgi:hypothetical protein